MQLESRIVIRRAPEQVWSYLGNIHNLPAWDRGVASAVQTSSGPMGVDAEFDTLARDQPGGRMSYRIDEAEPDHGCTVRLTSSTGNARFFKDGQWNFRVEPVADGARVICSVRFTLRLRYMFLAPVLYFMKSAIHRDLEQLRRALETA